jgi:hypothetical protein
MENIVKWPEKLYKFTKVQGTITTYTFKCEQTVLSREELTAKYVSNYSQGYYITESQLSNYYTSLEACYEAWIDSIEKFKRKVIKQFEKKCKIDYHEYNNAKFKAWLDTQPDIKVRMQKVKDEMDKSK